MIAEFSCSFLGGVLQTITDHLTPTFFFLKFSLIVKHLRYTGASPAQAEQQALHATYIAKQEKRL